MPITLHAAGNAHLRSLIEAGKYTTAAGWDFTAEDGNALLGTDGKDWTRYGSVHLGEDASADKETKAHWHYPAAKADGAGEQVHRAGLIAAKQRAAQQGDKPIEDAAGELIDLIDSKEGKGKAAGSGSGAAAAAEPPAPAAIAPAVAPLVDASLPTVAAAMRELPRIAGRVLDKPLMIHKPKLDTILGVLGPRIRLSELALAASNLAPMLFSAPAKAEGEGAGSTPPQSAKPYDVTPDGIACMCVEGTLVRKSGFLGAMSGMQAYSDIVATVAVAKADPAVKGIFASIDSFGGEAAGAMDAVDALYAMRDAKPMYAMVDDNALSAGYALASAFDKIFVTRTSLTGSIGVIALHVDQSSKDQQDGLKYEFVFAGDHKNDFSAHAPLSDAGRTFLKSMIDQEYGLFLDTVARNRKMDAAKVRATASAVFLAPDAVAAGFADAIGTPQDAMAALSADIAARQPKETPVPVLPVAPAGAAASASEAANVVDLAKVRGEGAAEASARALEVVELCKLAGRADAAGDFIKRGLSVDQVRQALTDLRAEASAARQTSGHIVPTAGNEDTQAAAAGWARAFEPYMPKENKA